MKMTVFNGSPKAERGNTYVMVEAFLQGAQEAGVEGEHILLARQTIKPCIACGTCWVKTPGQCIHDDDDMHALLPKILASDILGFATPLYVDNVTGLMKNFMDRLVIIGDPHWEQDEQGECRHVRRYPKPDKIMVIANCGYPEQSHFQVLRLLFRRIARNLHAELIAEIYRGGGGLLTARIPALQPIVENYKHLLRQAGKEIGEQGKLSETTSTKLEQPLLPGPNYAEDYMQRINQLWDKVLSKPEPQADGELGSRVL
jgi:multimeric flavodoxin WrbA